MVPARVMLVRKATTMATVVESDAMVMARRRCLRNPPQHDANDSDCSTKIAKNGSRDGTVRKESAILCRKERLP